MRNLEWFLTSPGLLRASATMPETLLVTDDELREIADQRRTQIASLLADPAPLVAALAPAKATHRLGRYLESLAEFAVSQFLKPARCQMNTAVREAKRTVGELDFLFDANGTGTEHWELSVKFYISVGATENEKRDLRFYMGTFVEDRLDRKIEHLVHHQLYLPQTEAGQRVLEGQGWRQPVRSRALMKGLFFYPSHEDWESTRLPAELSPTHERGWWTTSDRKLIASKKADPLYIRLGPLQWMSRFSGWVPREALLTRVQVEAGIDGYFAGEMRDAWLRRRELTFAEVEQTGEIRGDRVYVREIARGHVVHARWPELARWATERTVKEIETSLRENAKRPRGGE